MRPLLLPLAALLSACATTHPLDVSDAADRRALAERAERQRALVTVLGEAPVPAAGLRLGADSTSWVDPASGAVRSVATADVARVSFRGSDPEGRLSPLARFAVGFAVGSAVGAAVGYATYEPEGFVVLHPDVVAVASGVMFGVAGGIGAAVVMGGQPERFVPTAPGPADGR